MFDLSIFCGMTFITVLLVARVYLFLAMGKQEERGIDRHAKARIGHAAWLMHEHGKTADEAIAEALILWPHKK